MNKHHHLKKILFFFLAVIIPASLYAHGISESDKEGMISGGLIDYIWLGASHMLSGYDHLLFLFGVIFFLTKFKEIVKFITAFTLGHSITLIFATFMGITANYFLIDAVIALTVIYKGFDNVDGFKKYLNMKSPNLMVLVFIFGLIHGFGLSTRLQQLPLGTDGLLLKIISFNVGVEIGQIIALTVMIFILSKWRSTPSFKNFSTISNVGLMILGSLLFLMQMHGYGHEAFVDELAFSTEKHDHAHVESKDRSKLSKLLLSKRVDDTAKSPTPEDKNNWDHSVTLTIPSKKSLEYKFQIKKGEIFKYQWASDGGSLFYDFHGDPSDGSRFKSYKKTTELSSTGSFTSPFDGSHGWYWKNNNANEVKVTLKTKGSYKVLGIR